MAKKDSSGRIVAGGWTPCVEALLGGPGWRSRQLGCKLSCTTGCECVDAAEGGMWEHEQVRRTVARMKAAADSDENETAIPTTDGSGVFLDDGRGSQT